MVAQKFIIIFVVFLFQIIIIKQFFATIYKRLLIY
jgi:hypothetical protein